MKVMTKIMLSALCAAAMVTSASAQGGKDVLSNGIKYLDVPYVAHTLEADGPEELVINCDEVDLSLIHIYQSDFREEDAQERKNTNGHDKDS